MYADTIKYNEEPLDSCVGFIDGHKIQMAMASISNYFQRSSY